ncbi:hypothetical protein IMCC14465_03790 [alpha proteobacterium IMCC14465]|uniref:8-amino-7-ketopelargonate synthase n=1 Tax=alpha proteobacterium IMCC14465 TaxID=1220535 RepID=J9A6I4_9PROT|nr:hypothetical protein IMCC14465_03790 [alpha proteobacterium IMCC14465]
MKINQNSLDIFCAEKINKLEEASGFRTLKTTHRASGAQSQQAGKSLISFSCNDYLGLSHHPVILEKAHEAAKLYGAGAAASRLITGNYPLLESLEKKLAKLKNTQACLVFGSGFLANIGLIPALVGADDVILVDELAHACLNSGARLSGAKTIRFKHNDCEDLENHLKMQRSSFSKCLILTDTVFSMDGDLAPLPSFRDIANRYDSWLITDDAHGIGVLGAGRGGGFAFNPPVEADVQMGTLSKALGSYGGYVCGSQKLIDLLVNRARSFVYSTGLPPMSTAAALAALEIIEQDPTLVDKPLAHARRFCERVGLSIPQSPIVPVIFGGNETVMKISEKLAQEGFLVSAIRPPTVPENTARLRIAFNAAHEAEHIDRLADLVRDARKEYGSI